MTNNERNERRRGIAFWRKSTGNYCSHYLGLTKEDRLSLIEELQAERPVRMILYSQTDNGANSPDFVLRFFKQDEAQEGFSKPLQAPVVSTTQSDSI